MEHRRREQPLSPRPPPTLTREEPAAGRPQTREGALLGGDQAVTSVCHTGPPRDGTSTCPLCVPD